MDQIQPQPVPTVWGFDHTQEGTHVVILVSTPLGQLVHFVEAGNVDAVCNAMQQQKEKCEGGGDIMVPNNVILDAHGNPLKVVPPSQDVQEHLARMAAAAEADGTAMPIDTTAKDVSDMTPDEAFAAGAEAQERHLHSVTDDEPKHDLGGES